MSTDPEVIEAVLRGELDQYAVLVDRYERAALQLAFSFVGNFEDAKEISQNGFVKAYQKLAAFRREAKFSTWLYRIVVNECKDFLRRKARRPGFVSLGQGRGEEEGEMELFEVADPKGDPRQLLQEKELGRRLSRAIGRLSERQKTAFCLHHVNGFSQEEVSQVMGCRLGTVKAHLARAAEALRESMEPYLKGQG